MARLSSDSSTGSRDCASSSVKVFMADSLPLGYDETVCGTRDLWFDPYYLRAMTSMRIRREWRP